MRCIRCNQEIGNNKHCGYCGCKQNKKTNKKIIALICFVLIPSILIFSGFMIFNFINMNYSGIKSFYSDEEYMIKGEECSITFFARTEHDLSEVSVFSDEKIADMNDDGLNGDAKANDGIYSVTITIKENNKNEIEFCAKSKEFTSEKIKIHFFDKPDNDTKNEIVSYQDKIDSIESNYLVDGYVEVNNIQKVLDEVESYAKELVQSGKALFYEKTESSVIIKLSNGLTIAYSPQLKGTYSIGNDTNMTVDAYQPYYEDVKNFTDKYIDLPKGINAESELINAAAKEVYGSFNNYSMGNILYDDQVSLSNVKDFDKNKIILWQGHGTYGGEKLHSLIYTGADFNWDAFNWDISYFLDCCQDRIVKCGNSELFSYKYVEKYCNNLDNSFIYLGPCESGMDETLANTFLKKGAAAVIANSKTILCLYGDLMEYTTTYYLTQVNESTGNYYTLSEALNAAKQKYGNNDSKYNGLGAEPIIFGGESANNYRLADYNDSNNHNPNFQAGKSLIYMNNKLICAKSNAIYYKESINSKEKKIAYSGNVSSLLSDGETVYYVEGVDNSECNSDNRFTPKKVYKATTSGSKSDYIFTSNGQADLITYQNDCIYYLDVTMKGSSDYLYSLMKYDLNTGATKKIAGEWTGEMPAYWKQNAFCMGDTIFVTVNHSLCSYDINNDKYNELISANDGYICDTIDDKVCFSYSTNGSRYISTITSNGNIETSKPFDAKKYDLQIVDNSGEFALFFNTDSSDNETMFDLYRINLKTGEIKTSKGEAGRYKFKNYFVIKDLSKPNDIYFMYNVGLYDNSSNKILNKKHDDFDFDITKQMWIVDGYVVDWNFNTYKIYDESKDIPKN